MQSNVRNAWYQCSMLSVVVIQYVVINEEMTGQSFEEAAGVAIMAYLLMYCIIVNVIYRK